MNEMIERGAEAMRAKRRELINQPLDRLWPDLMRAAIEAMREPTSDMLAAATPYPRYLAIKYTAMIDQALIELSPLREADTADLYGVPRATE